MEPHVLAEFGISAEEAREGGWRVLGDDEPDEDDWSLEKHRAWMNAALGSLGSSGHYHT